MRIYFNQNNVAGISLECLGPNMDLVASDEVPISITSTEIDLLEAGKSVATANDMSCNMSFPAAAFTYQMAGDQLMLTGPNSETLNFSRIQ